MLFLQNIEKSHQTIVRANRRLRAGNRIAPVDELLAADALLYAGL